MSIQEIKDLLDQVLVFEVGFKENILAKAQNLDELRLVELKKILQEVKIWQENVLIRMIKEDPGFIEKLTDSRRKAEQKVMDLYRQKLEKDDRAKMEIILNKMKSL